MREYWQQKPLLVREALAGFESPLSPEELAGLACEPDVASRLVQERGGEYPWQVRHGPFQQADFTTLPSAHYSLLVQEVDRLVPEVADLLRNVSFLPNWRIDDVMVSYAPEHGSVGAHVDSYDVFLLQGLGRRRWQVGDEPQEEEAYVPDVDVRILEDFHPAHEWVLEPGDMLYLPPRVPHYGVALDDCMTYSIGCRAPDAAELALDFASFAATGFEPHLFIVRDPKPVRDPGELDPEMLNRLQNFMTVELEKIIEEGRVFGDWFGAYTTRPTRGQSPAEPEEFYEPEQVRALLKQGKIFHRSAPPHFAHRFHADGTAIVYAGGESYKLSGETAPMAPLITGPEHLSEETLDMDPFNDELLELVTDLLNRAYLWVG